jgi:hypothetical protein
MNRGTVAPSSTVVPGPSGVAVYNVVKMKEDLEAAVLSVSRRIQGEFEYAFKKIYRDGCVPNPPSTLMKEVQAHDITSPSAINQIIRTAGFYIILTDYPVDGNGCRLTAGGLHAVYRGECAEVRLRVMSHLGNAAYRTKLDDLASRYLKSPKNEGKLFYKAHWPNCLKLEESGGPSGINVDEEPYSQHRWMVLVHPMKGSSQAVRLLAEKAFDDAFGHPAASRDG